MTTPSAAPLPIGIVGLNFGRYILEDLTREPADAYFRLAAVCDLDPERAREFGTRYQVPVHLSLETLLADPEIGIIGLFTSPAGRADLVRQVIRAGKDVITTKPFELDSRAAREVLAEARDLGRIVQLNSPGPRLSPALQRVGEWVEEFALGRPVFIRGEMTVSYREAADGSWYDDPARCPVAPIFRLGIYMINDAVRLFGPVDHVQVLSSRVFTGRPTPDNAQLGLAFRNGALGSIYASFCVENGQHYANSLLLHYERGSIYVNLAPAPYGKAGATSRLQLVTTTGKEEVRVVEDTLPGGSGAYQWAEFHRAILERDAHGTPAELIVAGIEVIEAMIRSEQSTPFSS
jgi:predicted dehydrogenase